MKLKLAVLVPVVALALATSACTSSPDATSSPTALATNPIVVATPTPSETDTPDVAPTPDSATYATVGELKTALIAAGQSCSTFVKVSTVAKATGAGTCGSKYTIAVFATPADRDEVVNASGKKATPDLMLVGANWLVIAANQDQVTEVGTLQTKLGGFIVPMGS